MDWFVWFLSFLGVLGLIVVMFYALRKLNKKVSIGAGSKLRVLDRVNIGRDGMLLVISVDGKLMLIGATAQRVEKLCDLDSSEEDYLSGAQTQDFKSVLASVLWKKPQQENEKSGGTSADTENKNGGKSAEKPFGGASDGGLDDDNGFYDDSGLDKDK